MIIVTKVNKSGNRIDSYDCRTADGRVINGVKKEELIPYIVKGLVDNAKIQILVDDAPREVDKQILDKSQLTLTNVAAWVYNNVCPIAYRIRCGAYTTKEIEKKYDGRYSCYIRLSASYNKDIKLEFSILDDHGKVCDREYKWDMQHRVFVGKTLIPDSCCTYSRTEVLSPNGIGKAVSAYDQKQFVDDNGTTKDFLDYHLKAVPTEVLVGSFLDNANEMMKKLYSNIQRDEKSYDEEQRIKRMGSRA